MSTEQFVNINQVQMSQEMKSYIREVLENPDTLIFKDYLPYYQNNFRLDNGEVYVRIDETTGDNGCDILEV